MSFNRIPAEWEPQDAMLLTWPHENNGWGEQLNEAIQLYEALVSIVCDYADIIIVLPEDKIADTRNRLASMEVPLEYVFFYVAESNSSLFRCYGPIAVESHEKQITLLDFTYKGCSGKSKANLDNLISKSLFEQGVFSAAKFISHELAFGAVSIDSDGKGTLIASISSLGNESQNLESNHQELSEKLESLLGARKINWVAAGSLLERSSEGGIELLVRLAPDNKLLYTVCEDESFEYFHELQLISNQLGEITNADGEFFDLIALPWPGAFCDVTGALLQVTYCSFVVVNRAVLVPIYDSLSDEDALEIIAQAFPGYEIFGIPSLCLLDRGVSLRTITSLLPQGVILQAHEG